MQSEKRGLLSEAQCNTEPLPVELFSENVHRSIRGLLFCHRVMVPPSVPLLNSNAQSLIVGLLCSQ